MPRLSALFDDEAVSNFWREWLSKLSFCPIIGNFIIFPDKQDYWWYLGFLVSFWRLLNPKHSWMIAKRWCLRTAGQAKGRERRRKRERKGFLSSLSHWDRARQHLEWWFSGYLSLDTSFPLTSSPPPKSPEVLCPVTLQPASHQSEPQVQMAPPPQTKIHWIQDTWSQLHVGRETDQWFPSNGWMANKLVTYEV